MIPLASHFKSELAYSLIELLVVVALIGILSAVGIVSYSGYTKSAKQKNAELSLNTINLGLQEYKSSIGSYYTEASTCNSGSSESNEILISLPPEATHALNCLSVAIPFVCILT